MMNLWIVVDAEAQGREIMPGRRARTAVYRGDKLVWTGRVDGVGLELLVAVEPELWLVGDPDKAPPLRRNIPEAWPWIDNRDFWKWLDGDDSVAHPTEVAS